MFKVIVEKTRVTGLFSRSPWLKIIFQNIIIHVESVSDICFLFPDRYKSPMMIDIQGIVVMFVAGEPDFG